MKPLLFSRLIFQVLAGTILLPASLNAANWPQWRGPGRDGVSPETGLLKQWPAGGPKLFWQVKDLGDGYSTPSVADGRIYLLSNKGLQDEFVQCLNAENGKEIWSMRLGKVGNPDQRPSYPAARSTPTIDGDHLYALGSDGDLVALDASTGKVHWKKNLRTDFAGTPGRWAYAESPLIDGNALVCTPGGTEATLVALNKKDGSLIWKAAVPGGDDAGYASVIIAEPDGVKQYVQFLGKGLVGVDAQSGKFLWRYDRPAQGSPANIPTPIAWQDYVYCGAGRSGGGAIKLDAEPGRTDFMPVYFESKAPTAIGGAVRSGEYLYGATGNALLCLEFKTGKVIWEERALGAASICLADGMLYLHGEDNGAVALVEATPDGYREKGRFTPPDQPDRGSSKAWTYPVVAGGKLYIRDLDRLWCYDVKR